MVSVKVRSVENGWIVTDVSRDYIADNLDQVKELIDNLHNAEILGQDSIAA